VSGEERDRSSAARSGARLESYLSRRRAWWVAGGLALTLGLVVTAAARGSEPRAAAKGPAVTSVVRLTWGEQPLAAEQLGLGIQNLYQPTPQQEGAAGEYWVRAVGHGEALDVLGISGPGLTPSPAAAVPAPEGYQAAVTLAARFDCTQRQWWTAVDADYRVRVRRIDSLGRARLATVPLPADDSTAWREATQRDCLYHLLTGASLDRWVVGADRSASRVTVSVRVRNPADFPVYLQLDFPSGLGTPGPPIVQVPARGTATLTTRWAAIDCFQYPHGLLGLFGRDDGTNEVLVRAGVRPFSRDQQQESTDPYQTAIGLSHTQRVKLQSMLNGACRSTG
jgi:hypothetical protein